MPAEKRELITYSHKTHKMSIRQACKLFKMSTSVYYYKAKPKDKDDEIYEQLSVLAENHRTWGFWKMYHRLRHLDYKWNHKRVYRIYTDMRLNLRSKRKKRIPTRVKQPLARPINANITWSMDFMQDTLENGKKVRSLNVIDDFNREALSLVIDSSLPASRVIKELEQLIDWRGKPEKIRVDNGPEFIAEKLKKWCMKNEIELSYIEAGKPTQNSLIERFNRTFRTEVLDCYLFESINQMRNFAYSWMWTYNNERPHAGLQNMTPTGFLLKYGKLPKTQGQQEFSTFQQEYHHNHHNFKNISIILNVAS